MSFITAVFLVVGNGFLVYRYRTRVLKINYRLNQAESIQDSLNRFIETGKIKSEKFNVDRGFVLLAFEYSLLIFNFFYSFIPSFYAVIPIGLSFAGALYLLETSLLKIKRDDQISEAFRNHVDGEVSESENWIIVILGGTGLSSIFLAIDYFWL